MYSENIVSRKSGWILPLVIIFGCSIVVIGILFAYVYFPRSNNNRNDPTVIPTTVEVTPTQTSEVTPTITDILPTPTEIPPQKMILEVAKYAQKHTASCEVASAHAAMLYLGKNVSEETLLKKIGADLSPRYFDKQGNLHWGDPQKNFVGKVDAKVVYVDGYGVYNKPVYNAISAYGFSKSISKTNWKPKELYDYIRRGYPAVVWISNNFTKQTVGTMIASDGTKNPWIYREHAVVLRGVDSKNVYIMDVGRGTYKTVDYKTFERGFANLSNMAIVVIPD